MPMQVRKRSSVVNRLSPVNALEADLNRQLPSLRDFKGHVLFHQKTQGWWYTYLGLLWKESTDGHLFTAFTGTKFYGELFHSISDDLIMGMTFILNVIHFTGNAFIFLLTCVVMVVISYVIFYTYRYKDQQGEKDENGKRKKNNVKTKKSKDKTPVQEAPVLTRKKLYRRWASGLLFFAFLISIPWEFVRLYQSMVAEKVSQMKLGIPPECLPEEMSFYQRLNSFLRLQLSWSDDPCLVYHKALLVDPVWQVNPLMVITSAFSQCIVYPLEILFGGLGKSFRLFFSEIPAQWQPFMLIIIVIFMVLILVMTFGYRVHLPFLLKLEPKSPRFVRVKSRDDSRKGDLNTSDYSVLSSQDTMEVQSSLDTQYTLDSQQQ